MKRTIITSNYSLEELVTKLGHPRTIRRITEACTSAKGVYWALDMSGMPRISPW